MTKYHQKPGLAVETLISILLVAIMFSLLYLIFVPVSAQAQDNCPEGYAKGCVLCECIPVAPQTPQLDPVSPAPTDFEIEYPNSNILDYPENVIAAQEGWLVLDYGSHHSPVPMSLVEHPNGSSWKANFKACELNNYQLWMALSGR